MKILLIFNDEKLSDVHSKIKGVLTYIDKTFKEPIVYYNYIQEYDDTIFDEMSEAYRENDFDFYILNFSDKCHFVHNLPGILNKEGIPANDVVTVIGTSGLVQSWKHIKNFIKGDKI